MPNRRGRPTKFGRPARTVVLTLPENVLAQLRAIHHDLGWAVVSLVDKTGRPEINTPAAAETDPLPAPPAQLVNVSGRRALIVVNPMVLRRIEGVSIIPLTNGRGLISLESSKGVADLELAVVDRVDRVKSGTAEHRELLRLRESLRRWRTGRGLRFSTRAIIVVERVSAPADKERKAPTAAGRRAQGG